MHFASILVAEKGSKKSSDSSDSDSVRQESFFRISKNVRISVVEEFRPIIF